jgi:hypothetical protein
MNGRHDTRYEIAVEDAHTATPKAVAIEPIRRLIAEDGWPDRAAAPAFHCDDRQQPRWADLPEPRQGLCANKREPALGKRAISSTQLAKLAASALRESVMITTDALKYMPQNRRTQLTSK